MPNVACGWSEHMKKCIRCGTSTKGVLSAKLGYLDQCDGCVVRIEGLLGRIRRDSYRIQRKRA